MFSSSPPLTALPLKLRRKSLSASDTNESPSTASTYLYDFSPSSSPIAPSVDFENSPYASADYAQIRDQSSPLHGYEITSRVLLDDAHELDSYWPSHTKFSTRGYYYAGNSQTASPSLPPRTPFGYSSLSDDSEEPPYTSHLNMDASECSDDAGMDKA
ncbi:hypothetical protein BKA93DRAFT_335764 [Sparassis latifolia]